MLPRVLLSFLGGLYRKHWHGRKFIYDTLYPLHPFLVFYTSQVDRQDPIGILRSDIGIDTRIVFPTVTYQNEIQVWICI